MNNKTIGFGRLAAILLAALLTACANGPASKGSGAAPAAVEAYSHDAYFY